MKKNFIWMSINLISKLLANLFVFMIIARALSINDFGKLMYFYTISIIVNIFVDYGFNLYTVKEMAKNKQNWQKVFTESLNAKIFLTIICTILFIPLFLIYKEDILILFFFFGTGIFTSYINYILLPFRILDKYKFETNFSILSNVLLFIIVLILSLVSHNVIFVSFSFFFSRILVLILLIIVIKKEINLSFAIKINFAISYKVLKRNISYGIHLIVGTLYFQVDTIILNYFSDFINVANYQSAFRIIMAGLIFTDVLSNILLPKIATIQSYEILIAYVKKFKNLLMVFGLLIGLVLFLSSEMIIKIIYGDGFEDSVLIMKVLCLMLLFRYLITIDGMILTVLDKQKVRSTIAIIGLLLNIIFSVIFVNGYGAIGAAFASVLTSFILLIIYKIQTKALLGTRREGLFYEY
ncbi:oligosaccharide flippase family protein [Peribacillus sp. NPDC096447]|uniref:oligosaccharide flippase family protein n=1 Tax=Peribacillus sp. NPDC096447 TaxID=3364394 RepID=UPI0038022B6A